jgi:hypothetical protein
MTKVEMTVEILAHRPRGWPLWLWRFSGAGKCFAKIDSVVYELRWEEPARLSLPYGEHSLKIFHNSGTIPSRATILGIPASEHVSITFRATAIPFREGTVQVSASS